MGHIDRDKDGTLAVAIENESDVAQLRAAIKASDGADEIAVQPGKTATFTAENPFNFIALWATDFTWSSDAMKAALDCLVPVAQTSVHLHRRSQNKMMRRMTQEMTCGLPKPPSDPAAPR